MAHQLWPKNRLSELRFENVLDWWISINNTLNSHKITFSIQKGKEKVKTCF